MIPNFPKEGLDLAIDEIFIDEDFDKSDTEVESYESIEE